MFTKLIKKIVLFGSISLITLATLEFLDLNQATQQTKTPTSGSTLASIEPPDYTTVFSALPTTKSEIVTSIKTADARSEILRQYLAHYNSPLEEHAELIVQVSDENDFDYRWLVAIAMQESTLCKYIPENSFNCWGWGIYGDKVTRFDSFDEAIRRIAPQFKRIFLQDNHYKDPMVVMRTYTPPSDGSWANGVMQFFDRLK